MLDIYLIFRSIYGLSFKIWIVVQKCEIIFLSRSELESKEAEISDLKTNSSAVDDLMKSQEVDKAALDQANLKIGKLIFLHFMSKV